MVIVQSHVQTANKDQYQYSISVCACACLPVCTVTCVCACVRECVRVYARARVRVCMCVCVRQFHSFTLMKKCHAITHRSIRTASQALSGDTRAGCSGVATTDRQRG